MKRIYFILVSIFVLMSSSVYAGVNVQLNGKNIDFTDNNGNKVEAQIINSRTMVPMRKIFELLNAEVDWDGDTKTVTAVKEDTTIKLQINNEMAEITKAGKVSQIKLDSKPIILENRTLVPLRFISESLEKQVGWDASNQTAIIIDYDYFINRIKEKSSLLYELMVASPSTMNVDITRTYTDLINGQSKNAKVISNVIKTSDESRNISLSFNGNSELFSEISNEGWGNVNISVTYTEDGVEYLTSNSVLSKMLSDSSRSYEKLFLRGKADDSFGEAMKKTFGISENKITISTFDKMKNDFEQMLNLFTYSNGTNTTTIRSSKLNNENSKFTYLDYTDFDNMIFDNEFIKVYNTINRLIFNYDVKMDELLYDYPKINFSFTITKLETGMVANVNIELLNDYSEKVTYVINLNEK